MKNCLNCGHENLADARFCEECGQPFKKEAEEKSIDAKGEGGDFCSNCGEAVSVDADFCPNCGHQLKTTVRPATKVRKPLSKRQKIGIAAGIAAVC